MKPELDEASLALIKAYEQSEHLVFERTRSQATRAKKGWRPGSTWRFMRRQMLLIIAMTLGVSWAVYYFVERQPRQYAGEFQLLVEPITSDNRLSTTTKLPDNDVSDLQEIDYATLVQVLKSQPVLEKVLDKIRARYPLNYDRLTRDLTVERVGEPSIGSHTKLIGVRYQHENPEQITFVLNQLASGYKQYSEEERKTRIGAGVEFIAKTLPEARQKVKDLEEQLQRHQQKYRITDPNVESTALTEQAQNLKAQHLEAERNLQAKQSLYASIEQQLGGLTPEQAIAVASLTEDPDIQTLRSKLKDIETQISEQSASLTPENPLMEELREKQENLRQQLNQETESLRAYFPESDGDIPRDSQGSLRKALRQQLIDTLNEIQVLEIQAQAAKDAATAIDQKLAQFPAISRRHNEITRQLDVATTNLNKLLQDQETLKVENAKQQFPWEVVKEPGLLLDNKGELLPIKQNRTKKIALGVLSGLLLGLGAAVLREKSQDIFHSVEDLKDETRLPLLGSLPFYEDAGAIEPNYRGSEALDGLSMMPAEQKRAFSKAAAALYAKIRVSNPAYPIRSLVVSAVTYGDGTTTVAMHLAHVAASMGQRVLLVDANMTLPQLHSRLSVPNFKGLSEILHENIDPNQLIQRSPYQTNLFVLSSGQLLAGASQLLASPQMQDVMQQLHNIFDLVIYDAAPLQGQADASLLSLNADGMVLVVGIGKTCQSTVIKTLKSMNLESLPILGVIANFSDDSIQQSIEESQSLQRALKASAADDEFEIFRVNS